MTELIVSKSLFKNIYNIPKMSFSEKEISEEIKECHNSLQKEEGELAETARSVIGRARRVSSVATKMIGSHCDPIFRNGSMACVAQLNKGASIGVLTSSLGKKTYKGGSIIQFVYRTKNFSIYHVLKKFKTLITLQILAFISYMLISFLF